jgi:hypothetical protein
MKVLLKTKLWAWYLRRGVILNVDNLVKCNWHGGRKCVFYYHDENIKHLLFECKFARSIWSIIQVAFTLYSPSSIANEFFIWLHGVDDRFKILIRMEALDIYFIALAL